MNQDTLTKVKEILQSERALRQQLSGLGVDGREINMVAQLAALEAKDPETLTDFERGQLELIKEQLSENPPYRKVSYPVGVKPLPTPTEAQYKRLQVEQQLKAALEGLQAAIEGFQLPEGSQFQIVPQGFIAARQPWYRRFWSWLTRKA